VEGDNVGYDECDVGDIIDMVMAMGVLFSVLFLA
jgi:hypothetical protein